MYRTLVIILILQIRLSYGVLTKDENLNLIQYTPKGTKHLIQMKGEWVDYCGNLFTDRRNNLYLAKPDGKKIIFLCYSENFSCYNSYGYEDFKSVFHSVEDILNKK